MNSDKISPILERTFDLNFAETANNFGLFKYVSSLDIYNTIT
jgi:hypothetical protein